MNSRKDVQLEDNNAAAMSLFARAFASVIESLLFFGLASEALGQKIKHEDFVTLSKDGCAEKTIEARIPEWYLEKLKARWEQLDRELSAENFEAQSNAMRKKFESAKFAAVALDLLCLEVDDENSVIAKVLLSVHMLIYVAAHALDHYKIKITQALPTLSLTTKFLMRRMIDNGWCGKRLNMFESIPLFYPAMYFLSSFDPPRGRIEDHLRCDSNRCQASSSLSDPIHRTADCLCEDSSSHRACKSDNSHWRHSVSESHLVRNRKDASGSGDIHARRDLYCDFSSLGGSTIWLFVKRTP